MSVSSLEGSPVPLDMATKYQKIATEYAKIRSQFGVLKKAVVDEQNHSAELKETLRIKDQNLRKAEQEIDSLNFRNQQLTKRVTILQDELDSAQNPGKKGKAKGSSRDIPNSILAEELQKKISENAHLVSMLQEQSDKYESEKFQLVQNKEMYQHELDECKKLLVNMEETKLAKIESENKQLLSKLAAKDEALQKLYTEIKILKSKSVERGVEGNHDEWKEKFVLFLQSLDVEELLRNVITLLRNFEIRFQKCIDSTASGRLSKCIEKNVSALGNFINLYSLFCINLTSREKFSLEFDSVNENVNSYIIILDELSLYFKSGKDEETSEIFKEIICSFKNHWVQFHTVMKLCLTSVKTAVESEDSATNVADVFRSIRSTCDYFSSRLNDKFRGPELAADSEKEILATMSKIGALSSSIYKKVMENRALVLEGVEYRPVKQKEKSGDVKEEECCLQWKQKYDSMNAAYSKKIKDLEEQISCLSGATTPRSSHSGNNVQSPVEGKDKSTEITNTFGVLTGPSLVSGNFDNQESDVTKYFNARANVLIADRQLAESKVTALKSECETLQKRLEHSIECRHSLEASVKQTQETVIRLQEELTTTTSNYEVQLSSLSEHMANMNDKLAAQQEEIEVLNYQLSEKGLKKGKSK